MSRRSASCTTRSGTGCKSRMPSRPPSCLRIATIQRRTGRSSCSPERDRQRSLPNSAGVPRLSVVGGVDINLPRLFVAVAILAPGIAISQVSSRGVRAHERETAEVRRLGVGPGVRPDARRTGMLAQRPSSPHGGEGNPVAPPRARSPLDQLDPKQIPAAEQFAWQPKGLVAVLGEHGVRHWSYVTQTAFAASGKFVVSEGWGGGLRLWDAATMQLKLWRHPARAFAISPNGKQLAVAEEREVIRVYDLDGATLRERLVLRKKNHAVFWESSPSITFAPDGQGLAVKYVDLEDFDRPIKQRKGKDVYVLWRWEKIGRASCRER